jgi:hypothetical protein
LLSSHPITRQAGRPGTWRQALGVTGLAGLAVAWWFAAGQPLVTALF